MIFKIRCSGRSGGKSGDCSEIIGHLNLPSASCLVVNGRDKRDGYLCPKCSAKESSFLKGGAKIGKPPAPPLEAVVAIQRFWDSLMSTGSIDERIKGLTRRVATADTGGETFDRFMEHVLKERKVR